MLVHLGHNYTALNRDIELILDYKNITEIPVNMDFLMNIKSKATFIHIDDNDTKSVIITKKGDKFTVYYSPIKPETLLARSSSSILKSTIDQ